LAAVARAACARPQPGDGGDPDGESILGRADGVSRPGSAWDAFGICAALHVDGRIETSCPDCGEALTVEVRDEQPDDESLLFHCLVPAARWWDDIVFS